MTGVELVCAQGRAAALAHTKRERARVMATLKFWALLMVVLVPIALGAHALVAPQAWCLSPHLMMHAMQK